VIKKVQNKSIAVDKYRKTSPGCG